MEVSFPALVGRLTNKLAQDRLLNSIYIPAVKKSKVKELLHLVLPEKMKGKKYKVAIAK